MDQDQRITDTEADSSIANHAVKQQLERILTSRAFKNLRRLKEFLRFVVQETLADRSEFVKARTVAIHVFDRDPSENPDDDPIVRIQAGRLRRALHDYYQNEGSQDRIRIDIPKGSYVPELTALPATRAEPQRTTATARRTSDLSLPRIAVLPLVNRGGSAEHDYFASGLGEELSIQLARFKGLAVLAYWTTSQASSESRDVLAVGRDLSADFLICGSVARGADRVRVSIQCIHVDTGNQIWAERFDRTLTVENLFDLQDEIIKHVVAGIGDYYGSVSQALYQASNGKNVAQLTAYEAVLANHYYLRRVDKETHDHTRAALEHAVDIEPGYALAWAMLSALYSDIHAYDISPLDEPLARAEECAKRAMTLDHDCQHTHYASAYLGALTRDHSRIIAACDNIVRLNPNAAFMMGASSIWLGIAGQFDAAFQLLERSLELNPHHPSWFHFLPWLHAFTTRDFERALAAAYQFNMPTFLWDPLIRAATLGKLNREKEAATAFQEALKLKPEFAVRPDFYLGCFVHSVDTRTEMLDGLRVGGLGL